MRRPSDYGLSGGFVILLSTENEDHWVVIAKRDPDQEQEALDLAAAYLAGLPAGRQVAVAQVIAFDFTE